MRKYGVFLIAIVTVLIPVRAPLQTDVYATPGDTGSSQDAAREIAAARDRANAAAQAWADAQSRLDLLSDEKDQLALEIVGLKRQADQLQTSVENVAVNRYIGATTSAFPLLTGDARPTDQSQAAELFGLVIEATSTSLDDYEAINKELAKKQTQTEETTKKYRAAQLSFERSQKNALAEVARLKVVEGDRLRDEAVVRALQQLRAKETEARQRGADEQAKRDAAEAEGLGSDGGGEDSVTGTQASGGSTGGTTGSGGSGGRASGGAYFVYGGAGDWICPLQGVYTFADTWGAPRSGGRQHQGVDMIADRGTDVVAVVDGFAEPKSNVLGGQTISFTGSDGNRYYYAHLDSYAQLGQVVKGTVIGHVGETGNAQFSTPHLHFEIHPGGGAAVNPTPTVAAYC